MLKIEAGEESREQPSRGNTFPKYIPARIAGVRRRSENRGRPCARYSAWTPEIPLTVSSVATVSNGRCHRGPFIETPPVARRSMAVKAKLSVLPSFHPRREKMPMSFVISCSTLMPNPYLSVPLRRVAYDIGSAAVQFRLRGSHRRSFPRRRDSRNSAAGSRRRASSW